MVSLIAAAQKRTSKFSLAVISSNIVLSSFLAGFAPFAVPVALAATTVTGATGGSQILSSTAGGTYTSLTGPVLLETTAVGQIGVGTIVLNAPAGFQFDTGGSAPTVLHEKAGANSSNSCYINGAADNATLAITSRTLTQITFTVTSASTSAGPGCSSGVRSRLTFQNIRVRPTAAFPLATGNITRTGTSVFVSESSSNYGTLTEVGGVCNGSTATVWVDAGNTIHGGPMDGLTYGGILLGTSGNDVIVGTSSVDYVAAGDGTDIVCGGAGADILNGEGGNDTIFGGDGADAITGGSGNDTLNGDNENDTIYGGVGNDDIDGGNGIDSCNTGTGSGESNTNCGGGTDQDNGMITVTKDANPNDAQNFSFTGDLGTFTLDDDSDATLPNTWIKAVDGGSSYAITETSQAGWTLTDLACTGGGGDTSTNTGTRTATVGMDQNEEVACTFTNTPSVTQITVNASVVNNNGGAKTIGDVVLKVDASGVTNGIATAVAAGNHTVSADALAGYTVTIGTDCSGTGAVYVGSAQSKVCSITFDDIQPLVTVTKVVVNDDGGTKTQTGFSLFVGATPVTTGVQAGFNAGNYTVSETGNAGYAATFSGDCSSTGAITLGVGEVKSCTITNNDIAPKLTVTKIVTNDNGGTSNSGSFVLRLDGNVITNNVQFTTTAGTHVVSEDPDSQYEGSFIVGDCDGSGSITLALADVKHCYITNDDIPAHVIVTTVMDNGNGGTKVASDFTVNFSGNNPDQTSFAGSDLGVDVTLDAGSYNVTQLADSQYATSYSADCAGSVMPGETKYCTITNDDIQPLLTVVMLIINNNVGSAGPADFNPTIDGSVVLDSVATGVNAGVRTVGAFANPGITGYLGSISGDCDADGHITLLPGDVKSCVFTFDDIVPDGLSEEQQESIEEAGNGVSRGSGTSKLRAAVNFVTQSLFSNIAPGAFGGGPNVPYSTQEIDVICSMQKALPNSATNGLIEWLAEYLASVMNRNADQLFTALKDPSLCPTVVEQAKAPVAPIALKVNAAGYPVSSNDTWNKCITGRVTLLDIRNNPDKDNHGLARDCSDYHTGAVWYHPDLNLFFTFDRKNKITSVPQGYVVQKEQAVSLGE